MTNISIAKAEVWLPKTIEMWIGWRQSRSLSIEEMLSNPGVDISNRSFGNIKDVNAQLKALKEYMELLEILNVKGSNLLIKRRINQASALEMNLFVAQHYKKFNLNYRSIHEGSKLRYAFIAPIIEIIQEPEMKIDKSISENAESPYPKIISTGNTDTSYGLGAGFAAGISMQRIFGCAKASLMYRGSALDMDLDLYIGAKILDNPAVKIEVIHQTTLRWLDGKNSARAKALIGKNTSKEFFFWGKKRININDFKNTGIDSRIHSYGLLVNMKNSGLSFGFYVEDQIFQLFNKQRSYSFTLGLIM